MKKSAVASNTENLNSGAGAFVESVINVRRVTKVVKGGRRLTFASFVVVGDGNGRVGLATGKGKEASLAISKAVRRAKKSMFRIPMQGTTLPYSVNAKFGAGKVILRSASQGTGVIAGGAVRLIIEAAGIKDVLAKSIGSSNPITVARATMKALSQLRSVERISMLRNTQFAQTIIAADGEK